MLANNPAMISEYAKKAYDCGVEHHEKNKMSELLIKSIKDAYNEGKV